MPFRWSVVGPGSVLAGFLLGTSTVSAQAPPAQTRSVPHTVADLVEICAIPPPAPEYTAASFFCRGFVAGAGQYHGAMHPVGGRRPPLFCAPSPPPPLASVVSGFVAWAQANPQHAQETAVDGLMRYAVATYPCPPEPRPAGRRRQG